MWQRYLGEVRKLYVTLWLKYPRQCMSVSIKIGRRKVEFMIKKILVCSLGHTV